MLKGGVNPNAPLVTPLYIWVLFFTYIPFVANRTFNTTLTEWLQHLQQSWTRLF